MCVCLYLEWLLFCPISTEIVKCWYIITKVPKMKCHENASGESRAVPCRQKTSKSWQPLFDTALRTRPKLGVWHALKKQYKNRLILKGKRLLVWICSSKLFHVGRQILTIWSVCIIYLQPGDTVFLRIPSELTSWDIKALFNSLFIFWKKIGTAYYCTITNKSW